MQPESTVRRRRGKFRRVSKARILAGHPFKAGSYAVTVAAAFFIIITGGISLLFLHFHETGASLVLWALPSGALLGFVILAMERSLGQLKEYMYPRVGRVLTAFLLFFFHLIGYLAFSSLLFSYPLGLVMERVWARPGLAVEFSLFSANFFIGLALASWLRNVRSEPCRCF